MIAALLRLTLALGIVGGVAVLFIYAFVAAIVLIPILVLVFLLLGWGTRARWQVWRGDPRRRDEPPVIDHDPRDLPPER